MRWILLLVAMGVALAAVAASLWWTHSKDSGLELRLPHGLVKDSEEHRQTEQPLKGGLSATEGCPKDCSRGKPCQDASGFYTRSYVSPKGIPFVAHESVSQKTLKMAGTLLDKVLTNDMAQAIRDTPDFRVIVMGRKQVTTDLPEYCWLQTICLPDGRCYDQTRGIGAASLAEPGVVAEENVTCDPDDIYRQESITIHEFAHTLMDIILPTHFPQWSADITAAWNNAQQKKLYSANSYIGSNKQEYWAESVQSWFEVTARKDYANDGYNTRAAIQKHDPMMAAVLEKVFHGLPPLTCLKGKTAYGVNTMCCQ